MDLIFATANQNKLNEAKSILGNSFTLIMPKELGYLEDIPETGKTLEENSMQKCLKVFDLFGKDCFADDTGLEVEALDGAPGVFSARYADGWGDSPTSTHNHLNNMLKLLSELERVEHEGIYNRNARFRTVVTLCYNGKFYTFEGVVNGMITKDMRGKNGFGYDPIFLPNGYNRTIAQMSNQEKNAISHRGVAIRKVAEFLTHSIPTK